MRIEFTVHGDPKGQPRTRRAKQGGVYTPTTADGWRTLVAIAIRELRMTAAIGGPVRMGVTFHFKRPKFHHNSKGTLKPLAPSWHTGRPDVDNLAKLIMDVCSEMDVWHDDTQVAALVAEKRYCDNGERPGATIVIETC